MTCTDKYFNTTRKNKEIKIKYLVQNPVADPIHKKKGTDTPRFL